MDKQLTPEEIKAQFYDASLGEHGFIIHTEKAIEIYFRQTATLQARVQELEKEVAFLRGLENLGDKAIAAYEKKYGDERQRAETLMGLLELMHTRYLYTYLEHQSYGVSDKAAFVESDWQSYKKEHGLQSPENPAP